jgi:serine/threonine-protein kinase SRPK3
MELDNIQLFLSDNRAEMLESIERAESQHSSLAKQSSNGTPIYHSAKMVQAELGFPILCDFGSAVFEQYELHSTIQAIPYRAPEVILGAGWDNKVDIWNFGVLVWAPHFCLVLVLTFIDMGATCWRASVRTDQRGRLCPANGTVS